MQIRSLNTAIIMDVLLNIAIVLEIDLGNLFSRYEIEASLITESLVRVVEIAIIFQIFGQTNNSFALFGTMFFEWKNFVFQVLYKYSESPFVRGFSNFTIFLAVGICWYLADTTDNGFNLAENPFIIWSLAILIIQSFIDGWKFPD